MAIGKVGSSPAQPQPTLLEGLEQKAEDGLEALGHELAAGGRKALAEVQDKVFDGWVGKALSNPAAKGLAASAAHALKLDAYQPLPPAPTLTRPVVMVTGLLMQASSYDPMTNHLASNPKNGQPAVYSLDDGKFHLGGLGGRVMGEAELGKTRMFQIQYTDPLAAPTTKAPELAKAFSEIERVTKAPSMDVVAHSAGCTDFRLYLDGRDQAAKDSIHFDQVMLVGPASHGTSMGNLGGVVGGPLGVKEAGSELRIGSPLVSKLNASWDSQRAQVRDVTIIGVGGAPTVGAHGLTNGDGFMPIDQLSMPGAQTVVLTAADPTPVSHLVEVAYSGVLGEIDKRLSRD